MDCHRRRVPGTRKTHEHACTSQGLSVVFATPTGKLATEYHAVFDDKIAAETIHSAFYFSTSRMKRPKINLHMA